MTHFTQINRSPESYNGHSRHHNTDHITHYFVQIGTNPDDTDEQIHRFRLYITYYILI